METKLQLPAAAAAAGGGGDYKVHQKSRSRAALKVGFRV